MILPTSHSETVGPPQLKKLWGGGGGGVGAGAGAGAGAALMTSPVSSGQLGACRFNKHNHFQEL